MTIPVTLQLPVRISDGSAWIFRREIELPFLARGMGLAGWGLPRLLSPDTDVCTQVAEITVLENGKIYVTAHGSEELAYTKEQVLARLGRDWRIVPREVPCPEPGDDVVEGGG